METGKEKGKMCGNASELSPNYASAERSKFLADNFY